MKIFVLPLTCVLFGAHSKRLSSTPTMGKQAHVESFTQQRATNALKLGKMLHQQMWRD